jgi:NACalpha-BTF3-like transcription factor
MNLTKVEVTLLTAEKLGREAEKMVEEARRDEICNVGARDALKQAAKAIGDLGKHVDQDYDEGNLNDVVASPLEVVKYAKRYIKRAVGVIDNLATTAEVGRITSAGRAKGLEQSVKAAKRMVDEERIKIENLKTALEQNDVVIEDDVFVVSADRSIPGSHPGASLKTQRQAEEQVEEPTEDESMEEISTGDVPVEEASVEADEEPAEEALPENEEGSSAVLDSDPETEEAEKDARDS